MNQIIILLPEQLQKRLAQSSQNHYRGDCAYLPSASLSGFTLILRSQQDTEFLCTIREKIISNFVPLAVKYALALPL